MAVLPRTIIRLDSTWAATPRPKARQICWHRGPKPQMRQACLSTKQDATTNSAKPERNLWGFKTEPKPSKANAPMRAQVSEPFDDARQRFKSSHCQSLEIRSKPQPRSPYSRQARRPEVNSIVSSCTDLCVPGIQGLKLHVIGLFGVSASR